MLPIRQMLMQPAFKLHFINQGQVRSDRLLVTKHQQIPRHRIACACVTRNAITPYDNGHLLNSGGATATVIRFAYTGADWFRLSGGM
jgi:hypothetical protein